VRTRVCVINNARVSLPSVQPTRLIPHVTPQHCVNIRAQRRPQMLLIAGNIVVYYSILWHDPVVGLASLALFKRYLETLLFEYGTAAHCDYCFCVPLPSLNTLTYLLTYFSELLRPKIVPFNVLVRKFDNGRKSAHGSGRFS